MTSVTFMLSDHPYGPGSGATELSRLIIETAAESFEVRGLSLVGDEAEPAAEGLVPITAIPKPPLRLIPTALRALRRGRSLIHTYFNVAEMTDAVRADRSDVLVVEHSYMAESAFDAGRAEDGTRLLINTHALESSVQSRRRGAIGIPARIEARLVWRDELRCAKTATSTACLGNDDLERLRNAGARDLVRLDLILPPAAAPAAQKRPRAVFMGTRHSWPPNQYAFEKLMELWPRIAAAVPEAELVVTGKPGEKEKPVGDPSVTITGYVDDLAGLLAESSVLLAPVPIGGGVRVKVLEAARSGLAVVATPEAIGTLSEYLPLHAAAGDEEFVGAAIELLSDPARAARQGNDLYEANRELWRSGFVARQLESWISGSPAPAGMKR